MGIPFSNWLRQRSLKKKFGKQGRAALEERNARDFRAVCIKPGLEVCSKQAQRLQKQRFLMRDAPPLPLPTCEAAKCECRYVKFADRRVGPRRGDDYGISNTFVRERERRNKSLGRRKTDHE